MLKEEILNNRYTLHWCKVPVMIFMKMASKGIIPGLRMALIQACIQNSWINIYISFDFKFLYLERHHSKMSSLSFRNYSTSKRGINLQIIVLLRSSRFFASAKIAVNYLYMLCKHSKTKNHYYLAVF